MSPILSIDSVRAFMDIPRDPNTVHEAQWHQLAPSVFIDHSDDFTQTILESVKEFFQAYPYEILQATLVDIQNGHDDTALRDLRFMRRSLLIGRDAIKLCTPKYSTPDHFMTLAALTRTIGTVIDEVKQNKPALAEDIDRTITLTETLRSASAGVDFESVSSAEITPKAYDFLMTHELITSTEPGHMTADEALYHRARRMFRSVVHLGIVSAIVAPDQAKQQFAMDGIELNSRYGKRHTEILISAR